MFKMKSFKIETLSDLTEYVDYGINEIGKSLLALTAVGFLIGGILVASDTKQDAKIAALQKEIEELKKVTGV